VSNVTELKISGLQTRAAGGLAIRFAETSGGSGHPDGQPVVLMTNPWPESLLAFRKVWPTLAPVARLVAIDLPGFGHSQARADLFGPTAMSEFLLGLIAEWGLGRPHILAPDVGTGAALMLAACHPDALTSAIVGSGGVAYPLDVGGALADIIAAPDIEGLRGLDIRAGIGSVVDAAAPRATEPDVWEDYVASYEGGRFAESAQYVRRYPEELRVLADLLPSVGIPVLVMNPDHDELVPPSNGLYLHERLPSSKLINLDSAHFPWEQNASEYGGAVRDWVSGGYSTAGGRG
jgi:pimeloyl-ACP methyl ester carboxylesterase